MGKERFPELYAPMVDEAPRTRHRTVPMKVLVLGYPRTGTSSIQKALEQLGFGPCYHMRTAMNQYPRDCEMWLEAMKMKYDCKGSTFGKEEWDHLLGKYSSVCDMPAIVFASELIQAYPSAKIILTNRDVDSWHASVTRTVLQSRKYWLHRLLQHVDWATGLVQPMRVKMWQCLFDDDFERNGKEAMRLHYEEVRACAKAHGREVLEVQLGDGWEPLCRFLEVDVPQEPYPRVNEGGDFVPKMQERARLRLRAVVRHWLRAGSLIGVAGFAAAITTWGWRRLSLLD